jgi:hypothetical protein
MTHYLPIEDSDNRLSLYYLKATHYLATNSSTLTTDPNVSWRQKFNATIDFNKKLIMFDKEQDKTLFLLRWS